MDEDDFEPPKFTIAASNDPQEVEQELAPQGQGLKPKCVK